VFFNDANTIKNISMRREERKPTNTMGSCERPAGDSAALREKKEEGRRERAKRGSKTARKKEKGKI